MLSNWSSLIPTGRFGGWGDWFQHNNGEVWLSPLLLAGRDVCMKIRVLSVMFSWRKVAVWKLSVLQSSLSYSVWQRKKAFSFLSFFFLIHLLAFLGCQFIWLQVRDISGKKKILRTQDHVILWILSSQPSSLHSLLFKVLCFLHIISKSFSFTRQKKYGEVDLYLPKSRVINVILT